VIFRPAPIQAEGAENVVGLFHSVLTIVFFLVIAYICAFEFTWSRGKPSPMMAKHNKVYATCGWVIIACVIATVMLPLFLTGTHTNPIFWAELVAFLTFGAACMLKSGLRPFKRRSRQISR
jgi:hypothetical protein